MLTEAAIDEPRFERDGLLIEGQRTNYMLNSESPTSWGRSSNMDVPETGTDSFGFTYGKLSLIHISLPGVMQVKLNYQPVLMNRWQMVP